jgi:hypothetical protein
MIYVLVNLLFGTIRIFAEYTELFDVSVNNLLEKPDIDGK